jgi:N-acetylneuraminate synthase
VCSSDLRTGFTIKQWIEIKSYCDENGIEFLCSPFSLEAAKILIDHNLISRWKLGSGEITNFELIDFVFNSKKEVLVSTGLANEADINKTISRIKGIHDANQLVLMHCVSQYPTESKFASLNLINQFLNKFDVRLGHSDHSGNLFTCEYALTFPIEYLEVHLTPSKLFFGPDVTSSLTVEELKILVEFNRHIEILNNSNFTRDQLYQMSLETSAIFRKGLYWACSLTQNSIIMREHIKIGKPRGEMDASEIYSVIGKRLKKSVRSSESIKAGDF